MRDFPQAAVEGVSRSLDGMKTVGRRYRHMKNVIRSFASTTIISLILTSCSLWIPPYVASQTLPTTTGWSSLPNTKIRSVCPPSSQFPGIQGNEGCSGVVDDWNSGAFDPIRNRLLIWGGGHTGYYGNELYALDLNTVQMTRLTDPGLPLDGTPGICSETYANGTQPAARHTYDGLIYSPSQNAFIVFGEGDSCPSGVGSNLATIWKFSFSNNRWTWVHSNGSQSGAKAPIGDIFVNEIDYATGYDPTTGYVWMHDRRGLYQYNPAVDSLIRKGGSTTYNERNYWQTAIVDPVAKKFVVLGGGAAYVYDISGNGSYSQQTLALTGCGPVVSIDYPGLAWDSTRQRIVAWAGGNTVYTINFTGATTATCVASTFTGGPAANSNGTYKRFAYSPISDVFVVVNSVDQDAYILRLTSGGGNPPPPADSTAPTIPGNVSATPTSSSQIALTWTASTDNVGVSGYRILRNGTQLTTVTGTSHADSGLTPSTLYSYTIAAYDAAGNASQPSTTATATTLALSGGGSDFAARCTAPGVIVCQGFDDPAVFAPAVWPAPGLYPAGNGQFLGKYDSSVKASGNGSLRFDILSGSTANSAGQWRQAFGRDFAPGSTFYVQWRQRFSPEMLSVDFGGGGWKQLIIHHEAATCAGQEITFHNNYYRGFPQGYTSCGARGFWTNLSGGDVLLQQDDNPSGTGVGYDCRYQNINQQSCGFYRANDWMTFYVKVVVGNWDTPSSTVQAWMAYEGQPLKMFINMINFQFNQDAAGRQWNYLTLLPYDTGKDGSAHPNAFTWYDDLIISTQPIAPPGGAPTNPPPAPPTNLRVQ